MKFHKVFTLILILIRMVLVYQMFNHSDSLLNKIELMENAIVVNSDSGKHQVCPLVHGNSMIIPPFPGASQYPTNFSSISEELLLSMPPTNSIPMPPANPISIPPPYQYPTWAQEEQKIKEKAETISSTAATWKDALSSKSKLDVLVQKHKEFQGQEDESEEHADSASTEEEVMLPPRMLS